MFVLALLLLLQGLFLQDPPSVLEAAGTHFVVRANPSVQPLSTGFNYMQATPPPTTARHAQGEKVDKKVGTPEGVCMCVCSELPKLKPSTLTWTQMHQLDLCNSAWAVLTKGVCKQVLSLSHLWFCLDCTCVMRAGSKSGAGAAAAAAKARQVCVAWCDTVWANGVCFQATACRHNWNCPWPC